ncbi:hypothetical protein COY25_00820 [Candidatus Uhrbacteria bacterium CG_4_10_14_0_2_um_filter_41_7]|uniref:30S ribosomal protein S21 n=1 Tax=Candidatus Uhrbacteria bacterium CG_4_9_14_3_um_filter_41_35 TaxID=1975034 RepID=A0A2M7XFZ8_9BACT|nr:MAG: hypothetical protein COV92_03800 [Candidatus Uhrbacteria bacterium CG11_big_fil_rev_8_21_14_0_20_41_9]PIZ55557.1 MAG: hypothetical protein COY25_00820 [Candidatus Uhrbacteria bacterium CG_4_10_14_0_2_um_filter_41_7]PJA46798.1 MAG: hypothetical protein CO173_01060 [Candidatus Uhrbacteria bacterium CG_4_9_14_3_um_filter_41_35]
MSDINITKKKGESFDAMFRRFTKRVQLSGKILTIRDGRFHKRAVGKNKVKESALRRLLKGEEFAYKLRTGKISDEELRGRRRR